MKREPRIYEDFRQINGKKVVSGYRVVWYEGDERKRAFAPSREAAELLLDEKRRAFAFADTGMRQVVTRLGPEHVRQAEHAFTILEAHRFLHVDRPEEAPQLVKAVQWFIANYRERPENMPTVAEFVPVFLKAKKAKAPATHKDYAKNLQVFLRAGYGKKRLDEVTTQDIATFIADAKVGSTTKSKYYGCLRALFYFACTKSEFVDPPWLKANPVTDILHPPKPTVPRRWRYTLEEVKRLIQVALYLGCAPLVVFRLYTMLRTEEAVRFIEGPPRPKKRGRPRQYDPWIHLNLELGKFDYVEEGSTAEANREITLYPVLVTWLKFFRAHRAPLALTDREVDARRIAVPAKFGDQYTNLLRHTAISFRAAFCGSLIETATQADNTEQIIKKHYWEKVSREEASAFYDLTPDKFDLRPYTDPQFPTQQHVRELKRLYKGIGPCWRVRRSSKV